MLRLFGRTAVRRVSIPASLKTHTTSKAMSSSSPYTESWLAGPQSTQFYTRTYAPAEPPKALLVTIHGFAEHIGRYTHFHPLLLEHSIAIFALDQRGFGKTAQDVEGKSKSSEYGKTSWKEQMDDIAWALTHARTQFTDIPIFLMGHSMVSEPYFKVSDIWLTGFREGAKYWALSLKGRALRINQQCLP